MRIFTGFALSLFLFLIQLNAGVTDNDSLALVAVYDSTDGANWTTTWDLNQPVSTWNGVTILNERVTKLDLWNNNLTGNIPLEIGNLDSLQYLRLYRNNLSGTIPPEIGNFENLYYLDLYWNNLNGSIPVEIGNLNNLENLRLQNNDFEGQIPAEIGNLVNLKYIALDQNKLTGDVPVELLNCTKLESFRAGGNQLTSLPDFSVLPQFRDLWVSGNQLSGPLPDFFYNMTNIGTFNIGSNNYEGEISPDIGNLTNLTHFYWGGNNLSGQIPKEIGLLKKVTFLELYANNFSGEIPKEIGDMENVQFLRLYNNQLTGEIPKEIENLTKLKRIHLGNNKLTGEIPESITRLKDLTDLEIYNNQFSFLPSFENHPSLKKLTVQNNLFTFEDIELNLANESITNFNYAPQDTALNAKTIFTPIGSSVVFTMKIGGGEDYVWFKDGVEFENPLSPILSIPSYQDSDSGSYHCLVTSSTVPDLIIMTAPVMLKTGKRISDSLALVQLYNWTDGDNWTTKTNWLSSNPINTWFGIAAQNGKVQDINLSNNGLNGTIPSTLCNFIELDSLNLSNNNLSGTLPNTIGRLHSLRKIDVSNNKLHGRVPYELNLLGDLEDIRLSNNHFSDLPDLNSVSDDLQYLFIDGNSFTFEDIEKNINNVPFADFEYAPQDSVGKAMSDSLDEGGNFELITFVDGTANNYQWYKDGVAIEGATDSIYFAENILPEDSGEYVCHITNTIATELTLHSYSTIIYVNPATAISENEFSALPKKYSLSQNFPNPFNPSTQIKYSLPKSGKVELNVFNSLGQRVLQLVNREQIAGTYSITFNADAFASGLYFYTLKTADKKLQKKMLLLK